MDFRTAEECWKVVMKTLDRDLLSEIETFARESRRPTRVVFGTSGWRGEIGTDFTFHNLRVVTRAIINILRGRDRSLREALGVNDYEDVRKRGVVVAHDNRFLGPDFAGTVISMLSSEGIKVYYGGEATTPEVASSVEMLGAACAINITPSHNPPNYQGLKFNPSDGGPAGPAITGPIQDEANRLMDEPIPSVPVEGGYERIDTVRHYIDYLRARDTIDLDRIREFIRKEDCLVVIDHVHGASRGRPERLLDLGSGDYSGKVVLLRKEDDYLFGGVAPEPSAGNMANVDRVLKEGRARFRVGAIMDPDGDRVRFADHTTQIPMNYFGAMALHFLYTYKGIKGVAVKSVGTSNLVNGIAKKLGLPVRETMVGFKNFRPYLLSGAPERAIVAFEESDGITGYNHTLEKDALFGLLLAIEMVATTGKNLGEYLKDLMGEFGHYYPDRSGIEVDRSIAGEVLKKRLSVIAERYQVGGTIDIDGRQLKVADLITVDGTKIVLEDGSWLMIRPSGTEPKVRFYIEARRPEEKAAIFDTAMRLTKEAVES